jgi:hypothetical protein
MRVPCGTGSISEEEKKIQFGFFWIRIYSDTRRIIAIDSFKDEGTVIRIRILDRSLDKNQKYKEYKVKNGMRYRTVPKRVELYTDPYVTDPDS